MSVALSLVCQEVAIYSPVVCSETVSQEMSAQVVPCCVCMFSTVQQPLTKKDNTMMHMMMYGVVVQGLVDNDQEDEEEFEVDIQEDEAAFLKGISSRSGVEMSPIKIVKNPDGSLQRAAMTQSALAKERRELREQQQRTLIEAIPKDLSRPWEDPLPEQGERHLAQELRGIGLGGFEVPEWKKQAEGKVTTPVLLLYAWSSCCHVQWKNLLRFLRGYETIKASAKLSSQAKIEQSALRHCFCCGNIESQCQCNQHS